MAPLKLCSTSFTRGSRRRLDNRPEDHFRDREPGEPGPGDVQVPLDGAAADSRFRLAGLCRSRRTRRMGLRLRNYLSAVLFLPSPIYFFRKRSNLVLFRTPKKFLLAFLIFSPLGISEFLFTQ